MSTTYHFVELLGAGGMGRVYLAEQRGTGGYRRQVAVKLAHSDDASGEGVGRLRDEARVLGLLHHPAIVQSQGLVRLPVGWAMVQELVTGADLVALLKLGPVPIRVALEITEQVAAALLHARAHQPSTESQPLGLIHRDIKPGNIKITTEGRVKVLDFGTARARFDMRESETQALMFGSMGYIAPERWEGKETHRGDVYSLGITLVEMLLGRNVAGIAPGVARHQSLVDKVDTAVARRLTHDVDISAAMSSAIRSLIAGMLAFEVSDRYSAADVQEITYELSLRVTGPSSRQWAPAIVGQVLSGVADPTTQDSLCGQTFSDLGDEPRVVAAPPVAPLSEAPPVVSSPFRRHRRLLALAIGGLVFALIVPLIIGGAWWALPHRESEVVPPEPVDVAVAPRLKPSAAITETEPQPVAPARGHTARRRSRPAQKPAPAPVDDGVAPTVGVATNPTALAPETVPTGPAPAPPPAETRVVVTGDIPADYWLMGAGSRFRAGTLPPGFYQVLATFENGGDLVAAGQFQIEEGQRITLSCDSVWRRCEPL